MAIPVVCPGCKASFNVDDKFAGKTGPCPKCKAKITIPAKMPEVTIHAPDEFSGGGKGVTGKLLLKPIARKEVRLKPMAMAAIGGGIAAAFAFALTIRWTAGPPDGVFALRYVLSGIGLLLVSPPLAVAAYTFLRDDELEPHRGQQLYIRAGVCSLIYMLLWAVFVYVRNSFGPEPIPLPMWLAIVPPFVIVGGFSGKFAFDLETGNGFFHYAFYLVMTMLLGLMAIPVAQW